jgi:hypothetical protein
MSAQPPKIATPISHLFKNEEDGRRIAAVSDCLECREWCIDTTVPGQELIHFDVNINMHWDEAERAYVARCVANKPELRLVTFQMASCYTKPPVVGVMFQPGGERVPRATMLGYVGDNVTWLRSILRPSIEIGIENNNYYPSAAYEDVTDGSFIKEAVEGNGLRFLLDVAHAKVTAHNRPLPYADYLDTLPMSSLVQIHICTPRLEPSGLAVDAHEAPDEDIWTAVFEAARRHPVKYLTVEYYKDAGRLVESLGELRRRRDTLVADSALYR